MVIDPFIFKVMLVVVLMIAQAALWIWVAWRRAQKLPGFSPFDIWKAPENFNSDRNQYSDRDKWLVGR